MPKLIKPYYISLFLLMITFYSACFFGSGETVSSNVTTLVHGESIIVQLITYAFQLIVFILFLYTYKEKNIYNLHLFHIFILFALWVSLVSFFANDNFLANIKYAIYFLFIFVGVNEIKSNNVNSFLKANIFSFQLMALSILFFSLIFVYQNPTPEFRVTRGAIMHQNANEDALILAIALPFLFLIKNKMFRLISIIYFFLFLVLYNGTRGGIVMSTIVIIIVLYQYLKKNKWIFIILLFGAGIFLFDSFVKNVLDDSIFRSGLSAVDNYEEGHLTGRIAGILIPIIEKTLSDSPIYGFGAKSYAEIISTVTYYKTPSGGIHYAIRAPHNFFIMFLFNWGIIGLLLILRIYIYYMYQSYKFFKLYKDKLSASFFSSWVAFTGMNFISNSFSYRGWTILILLITSTYFLNKYYKTKNEFIFQKTIK